MGLAVKRQDLFGNSRVVAGIFTFSNSYATGGEGCDAGLGTIDIAIADGSVSGYVFEYDYANRKLKAYYADYDDTGDGALIEAAATTDLSAISVRMLFIGA